jgi:peptidoglycan/xylan/chitin deacetylase (PgdA/CDA1 family)
MDPEHRRARREQRRRELRRRRAMALGALIAVAAAVAVAVASSSSGSGSDHDSTSAKGGPRHPVTAKSRGVATTQSASTTTQRGTAAAGPTGPPGQEPAPILMYHVIAAPPPGAPFPGLYVEAPLFAAQMQALKQAGWHAVTQDQLEAYWKRGVPLGPGKPIVLTFDNGYQSQYTHALPVLQKLGWPAVENIQLSGLPPSQGGLLQRQIKGMVAAGWELDTQGFSHADLVTLDESELHYQVAVTRQVIQRRYGVPVNWFCYPSGHYDDKVVAEVKAAGYTGSTTVVPGWAHPGDDPYRLHRIRVLGGTSPQALLSQIAAAQGEPAAPDSYSGGGSVE